jgi:CRP-like cAMP-binding protein
LTPFIQFQDYLAQTDVFHALPAPTLEHVCKISRVEDFSSGTTIFQEGDLGTDLFLVISGAVELTTRMMRAGEQRLALLDRGQIFGELACFDDLPRSATATAFVDSQILRIPGPQLQELIATSPALAASLLKNLVKKVSLRLRDADQEIRTLTAAAQRA